jgi:hypothetical protein
LNLASGFQRTQNRDALGKFLQVCIECKLFWCKPTLIGTQRVQKTLLFRIGRILWKALKNSKHHLLDQQRPDTPELPDSDFLDEVDFTDAPPQVNSDETPESDDHLDDDDEPETPSTSQ